MVQVASISTNVTNIKKIVAKLNNFGGPQELEIVFMPGMFWVSSSPVL